MGDAGIIAPGERVELSDGEVYEMTPIGPRDIWSVIDLNKYFVNLAGDDQYVSPRCGFRIEGTQVAPDFAILRLPYGKVPGQVPEPVDCMLLVEVADSTVAFDLKTKSRMYARAGIPQYWVLDPPKNRLVVHRRPRAGVYRDVAAYPPDASFVSAAFGGRTIPVKDPLNAPET